MSEAGLLVGEARLLLLDTMAQMGPHLIWALTGLTEQQRYYHAGTIR